MAATSRRAAGQLARWRNTPPHKRRANTAAACATSRAAAERRRIEAHIDGLAGLTDSLRAEDARRIVAAYQPRGLFATIGWELRTMPLTELQTLAEVVGP